ncbi:transposase [Streptomyces sp. Je 1-369]|uniref:transposase n=1 Tax=Streptomyces sp. Je 1-369 TaxID=2966192 RepID=UPI0039E074CD
MDAVRLGLADDAAAVTADQLRATVERLVAAGHWQEGDRDVLVVTDAGYDAMRLAWVLRELPVEVVGRLRSDRVLRLSKPPARLRPQGRPTAHARTGVPHGGSRDDTLDPALTSNTLRCSQPSASS